MLKAYPLPWDEKRALPVQVKEEAEKQGERLPTRLPCGGLRRLQGFESVHPLVLAAVKSPAYNHRENVRASKLYERAEHRRKWKSAFADKYAETLVDHVHTGFASPTAMAVATRYEASFE